MENIYLAGKVYVAEFNGSEFDIRVWDTGDVTVYENGKEVGEVRPHPELFQTLWDWDENLGGEEETLMEDVIQLLTQYFDYDEEYLVDEDEEEDE